MNKLVFMIYFVLITTNLWAQKTVNKDGSLRFRGNVAIMVEGRSFSFKNGTFVKQVDDEVLQSLKTSLRAFCIQKFLDMSFSVVNRNDEAFAQVQQLIEENKLEEYLDGFSVQAKNQGADYLFLVEVTLYAEDDNVVQPEISTRLISIETNFGYHSSYRSSPFVLEDENSMREQSRDFIQGFSSLMENQLLTVFPEQYYAAQTQGKLWSLGAYQPNGRIMPTDKFYAFKLEKTNMTLGGTNIPIQVLDEVAIGEDPQMNNGYLQIKMNKSVKDVSDIVVLRNSNQLVFAGMNQIPTTFWGLEYDLRSYEGLIKCRINNAVFSAITRHPGLQLIEHEHLSEIKKERELQKSEEFIDGHVVSQMKAMGALYLIKLEDFQQDDAGVSLKLSLISIEGNNIVRTVDVKTSIDNIENEMYKQICERIANPCTVEMTDKDKLVLTSVLSLTDGDDCILSVTKPVQNPMTGETTYSRSELCELKFEEYHGNKTVFSIGKVFNDEDFKNIEQYSSTGTLTFYIDGSQIKSETGKSEVQKKSEKANKKKKGNALWNALKKSGNQMLRNARITVD